MKKFLCLLLVLVIGFMFCACGKAAENEGGNTSGYNLESLLKQGKIPEVDITLGTSTADVKNAYNYDANATGETGFYVLYNNNSTYYLAGDISYYFETEKEANGISSIVCTGTAFGLQPNTFETMNNVRALFPDINFIERDVDSSQVYFLPYEVENCKALTHTVDNHRIDFFFMDDQFFAVNIVDINNWKLT